MRQEQYGGKVALSNIFQKTPVGSPMRMEATYLTADPLPPTAEEREPEILERVRIVSAGLGLQGPGLWAANRAGMEESCK